MSLPYLLYTHYALVLSAHGLIERYLTTLDHAADASTKPYNCGRASFKLQGPFFSDNRKLPVFIDIGEKGPRRSKGDTVHKSTHFSMYTTLPSWVVLLLSFSLATCVSAAIPYQLTPLMTNEVMLELWEKALLKIRSQTEFRRIGIVSQIPTIEVIGGTEVACHTFH